MALRHRGDKLLHEPVLPGFIMPWGVTMGLLQDMQNCGLHMRRECHKRFPHLPG